MTISMPRTGLEGARRGNLLNAGKYIEWARPESLDYAPAPARSTTGTGSRRSRTGAAHSAGATCHACGLSRLDGADGPSCVGMGRMTGAPAADQGVAEARA